MKHIGLSDVTVTAFVAIGGILALMAPPINLPAMIISSGLNMPYSGFFQPLFIRLSFRHNLATDLWSKRVSQED